MKEEIKFSRFVTNRVNLAFSVLKEEEETWRSGESGDFSQDVSYEKRNNFFKKASTLTVQNKNEKLTIT